MANRKQKSTWAEIAKVKTVRVCKKCGIKFETSQGNRLLCDRCCTCCNNEVNKK